MHTSLALALSGQTDIALEILEHDGAHLDDPLPYSLGLAAILCSIKGAGEEALERAGVMCEWYEDVFVCVCVYVL